MRKIFSDAERTQLLKDGIYLEGYFNSLISFYEGKIVSIICLLLMLAILVCAYVSKIFVIVFIVCLILFMIFHPILLWHDFYQFQKKMLKKWLKEEHIEINWATIVKIDEEGRTISFLEDEAKSPTGTPYIVDYIATDKDCRCVKKGERIILVHIWDKEKKEIILPMIPRKKFSMLRDKEKCGPVYVAGLEHVPHVNAFFMEENDVIFHSRLSVDNWVVDIKKLGYGNRHPSAIFVKEWNGISYEQKIYYTGRVRHWSYGDILQKKEKKHTIGAAEFYFISK